MVTEVHQEGRFYRLSLVPSLVLDEIERLHCGKGSKGALASSVRTEQKSTASTGAVCTDKRDLL